MNDLLDNPELLAEWLEGCLTWRQLRNLAKRHGVRQYSYLNKHRLALSISITSYNRIARKHGKNS
jgi:hypothetical protein